MERKRYDSIQMLRAFAALCVVLCHIKGSVGGQFGVDIFMCITGFMIAYTTENCENAEKFLLNRIIRILPLYYAVTIVTYISVLIYPSMFQTTVATIPNLIKSFCFVPYAAREGAVIPVFPIGWTINYEMGFYFLVFVAIKFLPKYKLLFCNMVLILLVVAGMVLKPENVILKFWTSDILLEYCFGMFLYELRKRKKNRITNGNFLGAAMIAVMFLEMFFTDYLGISVFRFLKWGIPSAIMLAVCVFLLEDNKLFQRPILKFFVQTGNVSYSLYLTHYFVVKTCERVLKINSTDFRGVGIIGNILVSLIIAFIVYEIFERNCIGYLKNRVEQKKESEDKSC